MKVKSIILFVLFISTSLFSQEKLREGNITFQSPTLVYIYFNFTDGIDKGDTLYIKEANQLKPALLVEYTSSQSVAAKKISKKIKIKKGEKVFAKIKTQTRKEEVKSNNKVNNENLASTPKSSSYNSYTSNINPISDIYGRISLSSYSNFSTFDKANIQRWRLSTSFGINNIADSKISFSSYFNVNYRADQWSDLKQNIGHYLTIYDLAVNYAPSNSFSVTIGRKINPLLSNIGAIDGASINLKTNNFQFGAISGFRPNYSDYSLNTKLFEYGAYIGRRDSLLHGMMSTSIAFFQQNNHGKIDRRFIYLQHQNDIFHNLFFFFSSEIDLYKKINGVESSDFKLTNIYFSLRYRINTLSNIFFSYDARKNVIYYETFKSFEEKLLDDATRHGFRLTYTLRPFKNTVVGANGSFINRSGDKRTTFNLGLFGSYSHLPFLNLAIRLNDNFVRTSYLSGNIFSLRFNKYFLNYLLYASLGYKNILYLFPNNAPNVHENIMMLDLGFFPYKKTGISFSFEGVFEDSDFYGRLFLNISQRF